MSSTPLVTIIIPAYNVEKWIAETLQSVKQQTFDHSEMEIIIIDDGSTDTTVEVASSYLQYSDIAWTLLQIANNGSSGARNLGWRQARGQWIQFLDADDLLHPQKIAYQIEQCVKLPDQVALVYSCWQRISEINEAWQVVGKVNLANIGEEILIDLIKTENFIATGSQLFRRSWVEKVGGYDKRYEPIEDVNMLLRIAKSGGQFHALPYKEPLFYYRQRSGSLSRQNQSKFLEGCIGNAEVVEEYWRQRNGLTQQRAKVLCETYFYAARYYATIDQQRFEQLVQKLENLCTNFLPTRPYHLRLTSRLLGYRRAEHIAIQWRKMKQLLLHQ